MDEKSVETVAESPQAEISVSSEKIPEENEVAGRSKRTPKEARKMKRLKNEPPIFIGVGEGPSDVRVLDFTKARATELKTLLKTLENKGSVKRAFQYLPPHMRRRAMSYNPKRLPRCLREKASHQIHEAASKRKPPPSRKQRRKPSSLREEYNRRQKENVWLETHLWHAKRMKMCKKYGMCLPEHCNDKGVRAAQRSLVYGCLLSDISYYQCYEVSGYQSDIKECLQDNFKQELGLTIRAKAYLGGEREGRAVLYRSGMYPRGAVGPVHFQWMAPPPNCLSAPIYSLDKEPEEQNILPSEECMSRKSKLWIWCHPASKDEVFDVLQNSVMSFSNQKPVSGREVSVVRRNLVRFRLIGPRSHAVLMETLKPRFTEKEGNDSMHGDGCCGMDCDECDEDEVEREIKVSSPEKWWLEGDVEENIVNQSRIIEEMTHGINKTSEPLRFARGSVISMCVQDPRLYTPSKKTDMVSLHYPIKKKHLVMKGVNTLVDDTEVAEPPKSKEMFHQLFNGASASLGRLECPSLPAGISYSPLWNHSVTAKVTKSLISCDIINKIRSENLLRQEVLSLGEHAPCIPVILVHQPLQQPMGDMITRDYIGGGWDLILPPEWAMPFWISLIYRGARVCGMRELAKVSLESKTLHFPVDYPDTSSGEMFSQDQKTKLENHFMRRPPQNRLNFGKLVIPTPFHCPWESLAKFWWNKKKKCSADTEGIIMDGMPKKRIKLEDSEDGNLSVTCSIDSSGTADASCVYVLRCRNSLKVLRDCVSSALSLRSQKERSDFTMQQILLKHDICSLLKKHQGALVTVRLEISRFGSLQPLNSLSLPAMSDLQQLLPGKACQYSGPDEEINGRGMALVDRGTVVVGITSLARKEVKKLHARKKKDGIGSISTANYKLLTPQPSRQILGYITSADYRLTSSMYSGIGFVTVAGLVEALTRCHLTGHTAFQVLARGAKTKYYFVRVDIL